MWKAIIVHKIKERVWRCAGVSILPGHYDSQSAALKAAKNARGTGDSYFKDVADVYYEESSVATFYK